MYSSFIISQSDRRPMYLQIMEQIKQKIAVGDWREGDPIPSIRQLAADLKVSVITVKRAYLELEREGVIVTQQGRGSSVAAGAGLGARLHEEELASLLDQAVRLGALMGIDAAELARRLGNACVDATDAAADRADRADRADEAGRVNPEGRKRKEAQ
jgi:GntR family transcriptional regulator